MTQRKLKKFKCLTLFDKQVSWTMSCKQCCGLLHKSALLGAKIGGVLLGLHGGYDGYKIGSQINASRNYTNKKEILISNIALNAFLGAIHGACLGAVCGLAWPYYLICFSEKLT